MLHGGKGQQSDSLTEAIEASVVRSCRAVEETGRGEYGHIQEHLELTFEFGRISTIRRDLGRIGVGFHSRGPLATISVQVLRCCSLLSNRVVPRWSDGKRTSADGEAAPYSAFRGRISADACVVF